MESLISTLNRKCPCPSAKERTRVSCRLEGRDRNFSFFSKGTFIGLEAFQALALDGQFRRALRLLRWIFFWGVSCESLEGDICGEKPLWVCYVPFSMWNFGWIKSWLCFLIIHRQYTMNTTLGRSRCFTCWLRKGRKGKAFRGHFFVILVIAFWSSFIIFLLCAKIETHFFPISFVVAVVCSCKGNERLEHWARWPSCVKLCLVVSLGWKYCTFQDVMWQVRDCLSIKQWLNSFGKHFEWTNQDILIWTSIRVTLSTAQGSDFKNSLSLALQLGGAQTNLFTCCNTNPDRKTPGNPRKHRFSYKDLRNQPFICWLDKQRLDISKYNWVLAAMAKDKQVGDWKLLTLLLSG